MSLHLFQNTSMVPAVHPVAQAAGSPTAVVYDKLSSSDPGQFFDDAVVAVHVGTAAGSPTSFSVTAKLQDSADNLTFADAKDVDGNTFQLGYQPNYVTAGATSITAANTLARFGVDWKRLRRYLQVLITVTFVGGTLPTIPVQAEFILGEPKYAPPL